MKSSSTLLLLMSSALFMHAHAGTKWPYQPATVVSVANRETPSSNYVGNPTDAPLQLEVYSYDIGIQVNCTLYMVRYESRFDYLPTVFSPQQTVEVSLQKHVMAVNLPGSRELRLSIASRRRVKDTSCTVNNWGS